MKTNLLRIGLRLSLVVIALLCGVYLAWGQENTKVMHKISCCIYNHRTTKTNQKYPSVNL